MEVDTLILGAGPTGLGAAWQLDRAGVGDWLLCEAQEAAGGLAGSVVDEHGFTWDFGGHVQFSHYPYFDALMDGLLGEDGWLHHEREAWVWVRGRFVPYPFQLNLHRLPPADRDRCVRGLEEAAGSGRASAAPRDFDQWMRARFGAGITELFLRPYNFKVWARMPERMDCQWVGERVAPVDLHRVRENIRLGRDDLSWGPNDRFRFPRHGGTGAIWRGLAGRLAGRHPGRLRLGWRVAEIDVEARVARFANGERVRYARLLSTIPLDTLVRLAGLEGTFRTQLAGLEYASTHVLGIGLEGTPGPHLGRKCWMYFPEDDCPFYRVTVFSNYSPHNVPDIGRQWSLMAEVSESPDKPVDRDRVGEDTVQGLLNTRLIARRSQVHHVWHRRLEHGYPVPGLGRDGALAELLPALEARAIYSRGRFGAWKYEVSNQDHSFAQGVEVVGRWLEGAEETTLNHPEVVNGQR